MLPEKIKGWFEIFSKTANFAILRMKPDNNYYIILLITFGEKCSHRQTRKALVMGSPITNSQIINSSFAK